MRWLCVLGVLGSMAANSLAQPYAVNVLGFNNPDAPCDNCDENDALGLPNATDDPAVDGYYSLGGLGWIELEMGAPILDIPGDDFVVWEELTASWNGQPGGVGERPDETADVLLSMDGADWTWVGRVLRGDRDSLFIDIASFGMSGATYVRVEDVSNQTGFPASPGFDLDAIEIIPEPATMLLLLGVGGLFVRRR